MRARLGWLIGVIALVSGALLWGSASAAPTTSGGTRGVACGPSAARTLAADRSARIYSRHGSVYGCARTGQRSYRLGSVSNSMGGQGKVGPLALAGDDVGYGLSHSQVDTVSAEVVVRRLTDGIVRRDRAAYQGKYEPEYFETVNDIVVKRDGAVAWIASFHSIPSGSSGTEVLKSDHTSHTLLDNGNEIRTHSLRLRDSRLSWRDGSAMRSGTLR